MPRSLMLFVPLPFVVAILLLVLFVSVLRRKDGPVNRPFLVLILVSVFLSLLTGLRWGYGVESVRYLAPVLAATVPPLAYMGVARLVRKSRLTPELTIGLHAAPAVLIVLLVFLWRQAIDVALVLIFVGYAVAILLMMRRGTDALRLAPFDGAVPAYHAILFAACALLFSALVDTLVFLDLAWAQGQYVQLVITLGNLAALITVSIAAATVIRSRTPAETPELAPGDEVIGAGSGSGSGSGTESEISTGDKIDSETEIGTDAGTDSRTDAGDEAGTDADTGTEDQENDKDIIATLDALMADKQLFLDVDLNLDRLARRACIPTRQISAAVNRVKGKNVSQYVNSFRIAEACRLLDESTRPITEIMFEAGFQTKSNFNREFRRTTDMTPLQWRERGSLH